MRRFVLLLAFLFAFPALADEPKLDDLKWIAGHWAATIDGAEMEELWLAPKGNLMLGLHRDVKGGRASFEFIRIAVTKEGIGYIAQPSGRPPTTFLLVESSPNRAVFANPQHDFPKRILYWRKGNQLCARVEGDGGQGEQWCWRKR